MLRMLLKPNLPGGLSFLEALGAGLAAGQDPSMQPSTVINIEPTSNLFKSNITVSPRLQGSLLSGQEVVQIGLNQARLMPQAAAGLVHRLPAAAYAMYEPIKNLGDAVSNPFRQGTLPRITGQEGLPTLGELIQDALAGARLPVGMPPSPLGPNGSLGTIAALAAAGGIWEALKGGLAQLWGTAAGPARQGGPAVNPANYTHYRFNGSVSSAFGNGGSKVYNWRQRASNPTMTLELPDCALPVGPCGSSITWGSSMTLSLSEEGYLSGTVLQHFYRNENGSYGGSVGGISVNTGGLKPAGTQIATISGSWEFSNNGGSTIAATWDGSPTTETPWLDPPTQAALDFQAAQQLDGFVPLPLVLPEPAQVPEAEPITQPEPETPAEPPRRIAPPVTVPSSPPWISPSRPGSTPGSVPGYFPSQNPTQPTQPTAPDGTVTPTRPGPVTQTQPGSIVPWPGAPSIPAIGPAPRADLVGIAQEVGRIERKIDLMNTPGSGPNGFENLSELLGLLGQIWEFLTASTSGTTYTLDSPCEVDEEGVKLPPIEIDAPGAATTFQALLNRTDALAELIQAHKNLKQPGCKHKLAGEIVTVNFQQIE